MIRWLRQLFCMHECYLEDLLRPDPTKPDCECPCHKCGKVLRAEYGLAIPCAWARKPK